MKPDKPNSKEELTALVSALSRGSVEAYSAIYRLYYPRLYRYALQIYHHPAFVEDVLQDFFAYLAENCGKVRHISNFEVYLFQSVKRNLFSRLAREKQHQRSRERFQLRTAPLTDQEAAPPDQRLLETEAAAHRSRQLQTALAGLPDHQREILYLRYYESMSYEEICQILEVNHQVARNYVSRAIKQLKKALWNMELLFSLFILFC